MGWSVAGVAGVGLVGVFRLDPQLYLVCAGALLWGVAQWMHSRGVRAGMFATIMSDLASMPRAMRLLAPVQFFSWLALLSMWIYTTAAVAHVHFGSSDPYSTAFKCGANWVGVLFAVYNGFAALAATVIPLMVRRLGLRVTHLINVCLGGLGLLSPALSLAAAASPSAPYQGARAGPRGMTTFSVMNAARFGWAHSTAEAFDHIQSEIPSRSNQPVKLCAMKRRTPASLAAAINLPATKTRM